MFLIRDSLYYSWGTYGIGIFLLLILLGAGFIKYPDQLHGEMIVVAERPAITINSPRGGVIQLFVSNGELADSGAVLGSVGAVEPVTEVISLQKQVLMLYRNVNSIEEFFPLVYSGGGSLNVFINDYNNYLQKVLTLQEQKELEQRMIKLVEIIRLRKNEIKLAKAEITLLRRKYKLATTQHNRAKDLLSSQVYSAEQYERYALEYLNQESQFLMAQRQLNQTKERLVSEESELLQLQEATMNLKNSQFLTIKEKLAKVLETIVLWKQMHLMIAPVGGNVHYADFLTTGKYIDANSQCFYIKQQSNSYYVQGTISAAGAGKIRPGQVVHLDLSNYPKQEFGSIRGTIYDVSLLPSSRGYLVKIKIPDSSNGFANTNYGKPVALYDQLVGTMSINLDEKSLLSKLFESINHAINL